MHFVILMLKCLYKRVSTHRWLNINPHDNKTGQNNTLCCSENLFSQPASYYEPWDPPRTQFRVYHIRDFCICSLLIGLKQAALSSTKGNVIYLHAPIGIQQFELESDDGLWVVINQCDHITPHSPPFQELFCVCDLCLLPLFIYFVKTALKCY